MSKIILKILSLFKRNIMQNKKVISYINKFSIGITNWNPVNGQFRNPRVNWFFLLNQDTEEIRCFSEEEVNQVTTFLTNTVHTQFGNNIHCFINILQSDCVNNLCEDEVATNRINTNLPTKITPNNFGTDLISEYSLNFNIIGYFY